jgi:murein DD-endopeptidase MepM/ murein hydrolase activator NlpD
MRLLATPMPHQAAVLDGGGRKQSAYEVYVTNFGATPIKITQASLTGNDSTGKILWSEKNSGPRLDAMFLSPQTSASNQRPVTLASGDSAVLFFFPQWTNDQGVPASFETSITLEGYRPRGGSGTVHLAPLPVSSAQPIVIESPLRGANWQAANGPSNTSDHRRAIIPYDGKPYIGQRYAIDWVQLGPDGKTWSGDYHSNSSYHAYNQEIHAVADGKIVNVTDGIPENVPNSSKLAIQITDENIAGNHIIEDLGDGHFAAYAHLRPGTLKVKAGDTVKAGDVLARLGNTGNSSEPHLHFQVCDAPSFLKSEGLPFAINEFTHQEYQLAGPNNHQKLILGTSHRITREEPMENELDSFNAK